MRKWDYTSDEVKIEPDADSSALELRVLGGNEPLVEICNTARRYLYADLQIMHPSIPKLSLGPLLYQSDPPTVVFRAFNLLSAQDDITIFIWGSLADSTQQLPLPVPYSRFAMSFLGPSIRDFADHEGEEGWVLSWAATLFDVWLFTVVDVLTGVKFGGNRVLKSSVTENLAWMLLGTFKGAVGAFYVGNNTYAQFLQAMTTGLPPIIEKIMTDQKVVNQFVLEFTGLLTRTEIEAALKNLGPLALVSRILGIINLIVSAIDLLRLKAKASFTVDIPLHRRPDLRTPVAELEVPAGGRVAWPLTLYLPDGRYFSLTEERFDGVVTRTSATADEQGYLFDEITVYSGGQPEMIPVTLSLQAMDLGGGAHPAGVRPGAVAALPAEGGYSFRQGIGKFVQGLAEGSATVVARIDLKEGAYPFSQGDDRSCQVSALVRVGPPMVSMAWRYSRLRTQTGRRVPLELHATLPFNLVFDTAEPFIARVAVAPDYSWLRLSDIVPEGKALTMPFDLTFNVYGMDVRGLPIADFKPAPSMEIAGLVGPVAFPLGLKGALRPLRAGAITVSASIALDSESMEGVTPPPDATLPIEVDLGRPTLRAEQNTVLLEDQLVGGFGVTVAWSDDAVFSTAQGAIQAQVDIAPTSLELSSIGYDPTAVDPPASPLDLSYELGAASVISFSPDDFVGKGLFSTPFFGTVLDFISAQSPGTDTITVRGFLNDSTEVEFEEPLPQEVVVRVAPAAKVVLESYEENPGERNAIRPQFEVWHANTLTLYGRVENLSEKTELRFFLRSRLVAARHSDGAIVCEPFSSLALEADGTFVATVGLIEPGDNEVRVEAEKATNALVGGPDSQVLTVRGVVPEISLDPVPAKTGKQTVDFHVFGGHAMQVELWADLADGSRTDIPTVLNPDGSFNMYRAVNVKEGLNTLRATATNGIASLEITAEVTGTKPELSIVSVEGTAVSNGKVEIYDSPAPVKAGVNYCDEAKLEVRVPGSSSWADAGLVTSQRPTQDVDFPQEGTYTLRIRGSNDFGETSREVTVTQAVSSYTYSFKLGWSVVDQNNGPHYRIKVKINDPVAGYSESDITTSYETQWYDRPVSNPDDTGNVLPGFTFTTYEYIWDAINGGTKLVGTSDAVGNMMIWGSLIRKRGPFTYNYQMICALKKIFVLSVIDPAEGAWPDDGWVRFQNADVAFKWRPTGDAGYGYGELLP